MAWEFEDLSVNQPQQDNSPAQRWEFEDVNVPSQTVLDDDSGEVYAVPVSFDERDTRFAIETQTKGADKADFFGKIKTVSADIWNGTQNLGKGIEESIQSAERGIVGHLEQVTDTFLHTAYHAPEKAKMLEEVNQGNFARWGENLSAERKQEITEKVKAANDWLAKLRDKNAAFWNKGKNILRPEKEMDSIDRFWEAVGGAGASVGEAVAATMVTKNPTVAAGIISGLYGRIRYTEYFDKALEAGMDVDEADFNATVAGTIEGGIELAGERLLLGIAKIKPIQELGNRVLSSAAVKAAQSAVGKAAIRKIGSRHTNSVFAQALKGFAAEGGEEAAQSYLGMKFENATAVSDYSDDEILRESLFSFVVGGLPGAGTAVVGSSIYNRRSREINRKIKNILETETPELTKQESQRMADAVQEVLYQETGAYAEEMSAVLQKELDLDVNAEGIDVASLTEQTSKILKEHYQMSDEEIDKTLKVSLGFIDARNQFNEAYSLFREGLEAAGRLDVNADAEARILSARAVALARAEKKTVNEVLERWNLRFQQEKVGNLNENVLEQAMYRSKLNSLESFVNDVINNSEDTSARYFANVSPSGINFDIPRDTILHDKKHALTAAEWAEVADNIDNIEGAAISPKKRFDGQAVLLKISTPNGKYGVVFEHMKKGRNIITTAFKETDAKLDGWIKLNSARAMRKAPTTQKGLLSGRSMADIIAVLDENVNEPLFQLPAEAYNSQGKADVSSEAFKRWFGDSKVVDENGQPLKMVHFSGNEFSQFDKNRTGINNDESAVGFWFADKDDFAFNNEYHPVRYDVYLKMDNPLIIEGTGTETNPWADTDIDNLDPYTKFEKMFNELMYQDPQMWDERVTESLYGGFETQKIKLHFANLSEERKREVIKSIVDKLKTQGYDGIIIKNTQFDSVNPDEKINQYVVFEPNQIKSVYNRGIFDPSNDNIYYQDPTMPKGAYQNSIIYLFEKADASTVVHELAHFFLDDMRKFADNETTKAQLEAIYKYVGAADGHLTIEQHEYFARSFEAYLMDGRSPNQLLSKVFARFKRWLRGIYKTVRSLDVELNDEIRKTFDDMLGGRSLDFAMQVSGAKMLESLDSGNISPNVVNKALQLLGDGKMSRADMDDLIERLKTGELQRKEINQELKRFENSNTTHRERLNPFDKVKYKDLLSRGNFNKKDVVDKINRILKWSEPKKVNGKLVGRFPNLQMNKQFEHIRELMALDKNEAKLKIAENVKLINAMIRGEETGNIDKLVFDNKILSVAAGKAEARLLIEVYNALSDSYNAGRLTTAITGEAKRKRKERLIGEAVDVLTGDGSIDWRKERSLFRQAFNRLGISQMSWNGILDILSSNDRQSQTGLSRLSRNLDVFENEQQEQTGISEDGEKASRHLEAALKGTSNSAISLSRYMNTKLSEEFIIEWGKNRKKFSKDQLIDIYMKAKDRETRDLMKNDEVLQFNDEFLEKVNELLTDEDVAVADALFAFYDENYNKINRFYEDKFGTSLGKRPFYSPRSMDRGGINVETGDLRSYAGFSGIKERTAKAGAIKIKGAFKTLNEYIVNSNHYIAFSDKLLDINAVLGDVQVKNIIRNLFGEKANRRISYEISRIASNDKVFSMMGLGDLFNKVRSNYAVSVLGLKPALAIKQLTSFPAYWEHMSLADFMAGMVDFTRHPKQAMKILSQTTLMKSRDVNIIKDFEELSKSELLKKGGNKIGLRELMMLNIRLGDRGAIYLGGWALYKSELKKNLAAGMDEAKAKAKALEAFERITDETQQSGRLSQQSYWQSNPFLRAFTMFQSSQNQYLRKEINAVRGLLTRRMDKDKVAKTLFIYHVLLPCLFQWAADGFRWDDKAQLKAALLGSLNGVFALNTVLSKLYDVTLGDGNTFTSDVKVKDVVPFWGSVEELKKQFVKFAEEGITTEDYFDVVKAFAKPVGELSGIPVKYPLDVIKNFGDYADGGEYGKEVLLWLGWSPYALRDLD